MIFLKTSQNSVKFSKFKNKSYHFSYNLARNRVKLRIFIFKFPTFSSNSDKIEIIFHKNFSNSQNISQNSKINLLDFHTIWPKTHQNYGSLFSKTSKISKNSRKFKNKSYRFSYKMARNLVKLRIFIFQNSRNLRAYVRFAVIFKLLEK